MSPKLGNLHEDKFIERHNFIKMTEKAENLNRPITNKEIELLIKNF